MGKVIETKIPPMAAIPTNGRVIESGAGFQSCQGHFLAGLHVVRGMERLGQVSKDTLHGRQGEGIRQGLGVFCGLPLSIAS